MQDPGAPLINRPTGFQPGHTRGFRKGERPPSRVYAHEETLAHVTFAEGVLGTPQGTEQHAVRQLRARYGCGVSSAPLFEYAIDDPVPPLP